MNRFATFTTEERSFIRRSLIRLVNDTIKHGCSEHLPKAGDILKLVMELDLVPEKAGDQTKTS